jgi:glycosyltransferase involved in cell wall biosynthesis
MNVMYIDGVGPFGGASRSLFELVNELSKLGVGSYFIAARGTSNYYYSQVSNNIVVSVGLTRFDNTRYSRYRGFRWLVLLRELFYLIPAIFSILKAYRKWGGDVDIIHANEITEIFPALFAKLIFRKPLVVHVRSLQSNNSKSIRTKFINFLLSNFVDRIIAIDMNVADTLPSNLVTCVIHNSFSPMNFPGEDLGRYSSILSSKKFKVGFVGNMQISKGARELVESAKIIADKGYIMDFIVIGSNARQDNKLLKYFLNIFGLNQNIFENVENFIESSDLGDSFHLLGSIKNIHEIYDKINVLVFPSHFDAPGRPVFEAAFFSVPSIVAVKNPMPDTLQHLVTGFALKDCNSISIANSLMYLHDNPELVLSMGRSARELALLNFNPSSNAKKVFDLYGEVSTLKPFH